LQLKAAIGDLIYQFRDVGGAFEVDVVSNLIVRLLVRAHYCNIAI
jgi:hypothetical protein